MRLLTLILICFSSTAFAQHHIQIETQFGGSNFLGASINASSSFSVAKTQKHFLTPSLGVGALLPSFSNQSLVVHAGLNYEYLQYGMGVEASSFSIPPFAQPENMMKDFIDVLVYPNINYRFKLPQDLYIKTSAGVFFAFTKQFDQIMFEGDVIPGVGVSIGRRYQMKTENTDEKIQFEG